TCPRCGKATFIGGGTCNHCKQAFTIAKLEDVFMKTDELESTASRVVPGDDGASHVVMLLREKGKKGTPDAHRISVTEFRRHSDGWKHWNAVVYDMALAGEIAKRVLEVAP